MKKNNIIHEGIPIDVSPGTPQWEQRKKERQKEALINLVLFSKGESAIIILEQHRYILDKAANYWLPIENSLYDNMGDLLERSLLLVQDCIPNDLKIEVTEELEKRKKKSQSREQIRQKEAEKKWADWDAQREASRKLNELKIQQQEEEAEKKRQAQLELQQQREAERNAKEEKRMMKAKAQLEFQAEQDRLAEEKYQAGLQQLKEWALTNGTELLQRRIEDDFEWVELAEEEYALWHAPEKFSLEYKAKSDPPNAYPLRTPALEQIEQWRTVRMKHSDARLMRYETKSANYPKNYMEDYILITIPLPTGDTLDLALVVNNGFLVK